jgi:hypothetical protein
MTMELQIRYPEDFPLHGLDRDAFEARLRDALHYCFYGRKIRQLAEQIDARRAPTYHGALPLRQIADEHAFEECMTLDGCRIDDMSTSLRRSLLRSVGAGIGITLSERDGAALPRLPDTAEDDRATHEQTATAPPVRTRPARGGLALLFVAAVFIFAGTVEWEMIRSGAIPHAMPAPPARQATQADDAAHGRRLPMVATVISSTPRQTLRQLADSVPDDHPYEVSVMVVPQEPEASQKSGDAGASRH